MNDNVLGVMGAGTMGSGIAIVGLLAGFETWLLETDQEHLDSGVQRIRQFLDGSVRRGKISSEQKDSLLAKLHPTADARELHECGYLIEAIFEDVDMKRSLFRDMNAILHPDALFLTNTSTLSVTSIACGTGREDRVVGMHFCNPAAIMKLVEISQGVKTSNKSVQKAKQLAIRCHKTFVLTHDTPGFILNYLLIPFENDCIRALEEGLATVEDIDTAIKTGLGYPMGTFELLDTVGLDVHHAVSMRLYEQLHDPRYAPPPLVQRMIDANLLGRKTGQGFYTYGKAGVFGG
ncbi:MAG: 3-hydroxybutyryl-CoA dehydrogenase [Sulfobacillus acidophilus]|uniref:3-hydroxybutyryl-CoA dehydrogenase n=1 Tax=Sulfobacillus acidophilus TaxID=53633 RepID=A0A2T2WNC1_9FIRM|nr:MAG: 3-hydroxybutyryl-CoA dehydrogenase [Sulfobacillus acidophilus]